MACLLKKHAHYDTHNTTTTFKRNAANYSATVVAASCNPTRHQIGKVTSSRIPKYCENFCACISRGGVLICQLRTRSAFIQCGRKLTRYKFIIHVSYRSTWKCKKAARECVVVWRHFATLMFSQCLWFPTELLYRRPINTPRKCRRREIDQPEIRAGIWLTFYRKIINFLLPVIAHQPPHLIEYKYNAIQ